MSAVADRRRAFAWLDLEALDRIDTYTPEANVKGVNNVYLALCRIAARRYDGNHSGFEASRPELAAVAKTSTKTIDRHVAELERLGLVDVERRSVNGSPIPSRYVLVDPPAEAPGLHVATPETSSPQGGDTRDDAVSPLTRARPEAVKKEEEREREGERAPEEISSGSGEGTSAEQNVLAELGALLGERGQQLTALQRLAIRSVLAGAPPGVDVVAAAARLRKNYGADGKAAHRRIGDIAAVLTREIEQSSAARPVSERSSRQRRLTSIEPRSQIPAPWKIHEPRPLDPPDRYLAEAWRRARAGMRGDGSEYRWNAILQPVSLAGVYVTEIEDRDGTHDRPVIVVQAPEGVIAQVAEAKVMRTVVAWLEDALGEEGIIVELSRTSKLAAAVAA